MRVAVFLTVCLIGVVLAAKYENIDIDKVLSNDRVLTNYIKCLLDKGPCTPEGRDLKTHVPEVIDTRCAKCSPDQKALIRKALVFVKEHKGKEYKELLKKYDPENKKTADLEKFLHGEI